eukprot:TRINITY_DN19275_c0_g2_i1.p1 TRINITY_DN19275_c0_g2~~TRINITY_DN19275_c0_g2_i1.p1  ORF type:complete len:191 (-),score=-8.38 TRINITY_DN19275_c0_g2_i1:167-688(-)
MLKLIYLPYFMIDLNIASVQYRQHYNTCNTDLKKSKFGLVKIQSQQQQIPQNLPFNPIILQVNQLKQSQIKFTVTNNITNYKYKKTQPQIPTNNKRKSSKIFCSKLTVFYEQTDSQKQHRMYYSTKAQNFEPYVQAYRENITLTQNCQIMPHFHRFKQCSHFPQHYDVGWCAL